MTSGALDQLPADEPVRVATETAAATTGPGASTPLKAIVPASGRPRRGRHPAPRRRGRPRGRAAALA